MYVCLAFGFQGRYRVIDNGALQLEVLRERLAQILPKTAGDYERDLSPHWRGVRVRAFDNTRCAAAVDGGGHSRWRSCSAFTSSSVSG